MINLFQNSGSKFFTAFYEYKIYCQQWYLFVQGNPERSLSYTEVLQLFNEQKLPCDKLYIITRNAKIAHFIMSNCFRLKNDQWRYIYTANDLRGLDGITIFYYWFDEWNDRIYYLNKELDNRNCAIINLEESDYLEYDKNETHNCLHKKLS